MARAPCRRTARRRPCGLGWPRETRRRSRSAQGHASRGGGWARPAPQPRPLSAERGAAASSRARSFCLATRAHGRSQGRATGDRATGRRATGGRATGGRAAGRRATGRRATGRRAAAPPSHRPPSHRPPSRQRPSPQIRQQRPNLRLSLRRPSPRRPSPRRSPRRPSPRRPSWDQRRGRRRMWTRRLKWWGRLRPRVHPRRWQRRAKTATARAPSLCDDEGVSAPPSHVPSDDDSRSASVLSFADPDEDRSVASRDDVTDASSVAGRSAANTTHSASQPMVEEDLPVQKVAVLLVLGSLQAWPLAAEQGLRERIERRAPPPALALLAPSPPPATSPPHHHHHPTPRTPTPPTSPPPIPPPPPAPCAPPPRRAHPHAPPPSRAPASPFSLPARAAAAKHLTLSLLGGDPHARVRGAPPAPRRARVLRGDRARLRLPPPRAAPRPPPRRRARRRISSRREPIASSPRARLARPRRVAAERLLHAAIPSSRRRALSARAWRAADKRRVAGVRGAPAPAAAPAAAASATAAFAAAANDDAEDHLRRRHHGVRSLTALWPLDFRFPCCARRAVAPPRRRSLRARCRPTSTLCAAADSTLATSASSCSVVERAPLSASAPRADAAALNSKPSSR